MGTTVPVHGSSVLEGVVERQERHENGIAQFLVALNEQAGKSESLRVSDVHAVGCVTGEAQIRSCILAIVHGLRLQRGAQVSSFQFQHQIRPQHRYGVQLYVLSPGCIGSGEVEQASGIHAVHIREARRLNGGHVGERNIGRRYSS